MGWWTKSVQEIHQQREQQSLLPAFVGREREVARFAEVLAQAPGEQRARIVFVSGQGGMGKSCLLRRLHQLAQEKKALTAWTDDFEQSGVEVMARLSEDLGQRGKALKAFDETCRRYRQKRGEVEEDPKAPKGIGDFLTRAALKIGLELATTTRAGPLLGLVDKDELVSRSAEFLSFLSGKLSHAPDLIQLVREPLVVLTPLWLEGLRKQDSKRPIVLFFDTYESTAELLEPWLPRLAEGRFGQVPPNLLLVIGGQLQLSQTTWAAHERSIVHLPLQPFTEDETRAYLRQNGTSDAEAMARVFQETQGLPVMVAFAGNGGTDAAGVSADPGAAVEHFLKRADPAHRQVALDAAVARRLNQDVVAELAGPEEASAFFSWLRKRPFVQVHKDTWAYHPVVRHHMHEFKRRESPRGWRELHGKLAQHYEVLRNEIGGPEARRYEDPLWRAPALEALYHRLCENPRQALPQALNGFLGALHEGRNLAREWAETLEQAERDGAVPDEVGWGRRLTAVVKALDEHRHPDALGTFSALLEEKGIEPQGRAEALDRQGYCLFRMERLPEALKSLDGANALVRDAEYLGDRARILFFLAEYDKALLELEQALVLEPEHLSAVRMRALFRLMLRRFEEALQDIEVLERLERGKLVPRVLRIVALMGMGESAQAMAIIVEIATRASEYLQELREIFEELRGALPELERLLPQWFQRFTGAVSLPPKVLKLASSQLQLGQAFSAAIAELDRLLDPARPLPERTLSFISGIIDLVPSEPRLWLERARAHEALSCFQEARQDYDKAIEAAPGLAEPFAQRARFHLARRNPLAALRDCERAVHLQPGDPALLKLRDEVTAAVGPAGAVVLKLELEVEQRPDDLLSRFALSLALRAAGDLDSALAALLSLCERAPSLAQALRARFTSTPEIEAWLRSLGLGVKDPSDGYLRTATERLTLMVKGDLKSAIRILQSDAASAEGQLYVRAARMAEAEPCFTRAIALEPVNPFPLFHRARLCQQMGRHEDARADLERLVALEPGGLMDVMCQGLACFHLERHEQAVALFTRVLQQEPDFRSARLGRVASYACLERFADVLSEVERLASGDEKQSLEWQLTRAELLTLMGRLDEAEAAFKRLLAQDPENLRSLYALAALDFGRGDHKAAREKLPVVRAKLEALGPDAQGHPAVLVRCGGLALMAGEQDRGFDLLEQALRRDPMALDQIRFDLAWVMLRKTRRMQALLERPLLRPLPPFP